MVVAFQNMLDLDVVQPFRRERVDRTVAAHQVGKFAQNSFDCCVGHGGYEYYLALRVTESILDLEEA
jgi:hypothetical protein